VAGLASVATGAHATIESFILKARMGLDTGSDVNYGVRFDHFSAFTGGTAGEPVW